METIQEQSRSVKAEGDGADRVCLVKNGSVFAEGRPEEVFYDTALIAEAGLRQPETVTTYLEFCTARGIEPRDRPITRGQLVKILLSAAP